jgi:hypothetical protein
MSDAAHTPVPYWLQGLETPIHYLENLMIGMNLIRPGSDGVSEQSPIPGRFNS